jgi:flavin reductase (DIM6/NTAB) family NADH-FMN oxidoreductase RutF
MKLVDPRTLSLDVWNVFNEKNALLTAGDRNRCNTMTVGWCQVGRLWNIPVCTVYVRPERYTYGFIDAADYFTISILPAEHKKTTMVYCGTKSGRDVDKFNDCGLTLAYGAGDAPYVEEAELVLVCKKLYAQDIDVSCIVDGGPVLPFYGEQDGWHRIYTGEIVEAYVK